MWIWNTNKYHSAASDFSIVFFLHIFRNCHGGGGERDDFITELAYLNLRYGINSTWKLTSAYCHDSENHQHLKYFCNVHCVINNPIRDQTCEQTTTPLTYTVLLTLCKFAHTWSPLKSRKYQWFNRPKAIFK